MSRRYPERSVRLFVKNILRGTSGAELRRLFEEAAPRPSDVLDVSEGGFFRLVRMRSEAAAAHVQQALQGWIFCRRRLSVYRFRGIKIFVGGLPEDCSPEELRPLFDDFGPVVECVVVKDYAFVHMDSEEDGKAAIEHLNGMELRGRSIAVQRSVKDRKLKGREQNSEQDQDPRFEGNTFPDPYYEDQPPESFDQDYRPQAADYRNGSESEHYSYPESPRGWTHSAQSHSYGGKSYDSHNSVYGNQDDYDTWDDAADSYSMEFSDSLSTRNRASMDVAYKPAPDRLGSGYRAQPPRSRLPRSPQRAAPSLEGWRLETTSRYSLYERVRLSPPSSSSYEDLYRDEHAVNKRYMTKEMDDTYYPAYEHVRLSPPHNSRDDFDRRGNGPSGKYTPRSGSGPRHQPYERIRLSPPRRSRENHRSFR